MDKAQLLYLQNRVAYARDQAAYKKLYLYFHPSIYKIAAIIVRQKSLIEEIVSDVMIRIWTMENKLAYIDHLKSYLLVATRNTALTYLKKYKEDNHLDIEETCDAPVLYEMPDQQVMATELSQIIEGTVAALPPKSQMVYRLIKEEGLSYKEACGILEISQKTLEAHMSTALKKLRRVLDGYLLKKNC
ncbi:sigma-70 family RNA polymerase sigma factor [Niabella yanshanensis]|uniref:Sigma-70 family RNA polymerase sigma factor n=1 Tax=Niabella yanshanensis TaxID=577386 RepID=A0ABZ0W0M1_9BACT|nr:sigma-70 family RNA polymerase sigma factor [Niabella yanshanensis]WQD36798.1 sigma-70 family RNA polymerase sigma factor [Niabella yanshanensis]